MKALTIHQPWATLIAFGAKRFETRSWPTSHRGAIAIHAGAFYPKRHQHLIEAADPYLRAMLNLPKHPIVTGAVIATGQLVDCRPVEDLVDADFEHHYQGRKLSERRWGDFTPGRFAWVLDEIYNLPAVPCRGHQRLWEWQP